MIKITTSILILYITIFATTKKNWIFFYNIFSKTKFALIIIILTNLSTSPFSGPERKTHAAGVVATLVNQPHYTLYEALRWSLLPPLTLCCVCLFWVLVNILNTCLKTRQFQGWTHCLLAQTHWYHFDPQIYKADF